MAVKSKKRGLSPITSFLYPRTCMVGLIILHMGSLQPASLLRPVTPQALLSYTCFWGRWLLLAYRLMIVLLDLILLSYPQLAHGPQQGHPPFPQAIILGLQLPNTAFLHKIDLLPNGCCFAEQLWLAHVSQEDILVCPIPLFFTVQDWTSILSSMLNCGYPSDNIDRATNSVKTELCCVRVEARLLESHA